MQSRSFRTGVAVFALCVAVATPSQATLIEYIDRGAFEAAAGELERRDFDAFRLETAFRDRPLDLGDVTVQGFGTGQLDRNAVDIPEVAFPEFDLAGTTVLSLLVNDTSWVQFEFDAPVVACGADFAGLNYGAESTIVDVEGRSARPPAAGGNVKTFFGVMSDTPFRTLRLIHRENTGSDGFGLDNLVFEVPEPGTLLVLAAAAGLLRRRGRTRRAPSNHP